MRVKDLRGVIVDTIIIYTEEGENYKDLYKGKIKDVPKKLLEKQIRVMGARKKDLFDIEIIQ